MSGGLVFENEGKADSGGFVADLIPEVVTSLSEGTLVSREAVESEIDLILRTLRTFWQLEPDQVMRACSALSARCTELCVHLHRLENLRQWKQIRTLQVERTLAELDRQARIASRLLAQRSLDWEMTKF